MQGVIFQVLNIVSFSCAFVSQPKDGKAVMNKREAENDTVQYLTLIPKLVHATVNVGNNGLSLFVEEITDADQFQCIYNTFTDEDVGMNMIYRKDNKTNGILLMRLKGPYHSSLFTCYSKNQPIGAQFVVTANVYSEPFHETTPTEDNGCMISKPRHINLKSVWKLEVLAFCSNNLTWDDVGMVFEGSVLQDGNIYEVWEKITYDYSYDYENGVMKASFLIPEGIANNLDILPTFSMVFEDELSGNLRIQKTYFLTDDKSVDGNSPAIRRGNLAVTFYPVRKGIFYLRKGLQQMLYCVAYGNPKPKLKLTKGTIEIEGETDIGSWITWDQYSNHKYFNIDGMNKSYEGTYICVAEADKKIVSKTIDVRLCIPANVFHTDSVDDSYINVTLTASHDQTNKIESADCYTSTGTNYPNWIEKYVTEKVQDENSWSQTFSLPRHEMEPLPFMLFCRFRGSCQLDEMVFNIKN